MARMFPERLPDTVESNAERLLFDLFKSDLDSHYTVFAGVRWIKKNNHGALPGEADFVIAHPERGVLVLEVKGGGIGYDGPSAAWHSRDRHGHTHTIKNPVEQAQRNFYSLRDKIAEVPACAMLSLRGGHAVAFPDGIVRERQLALDLPGEVVIDAEDLGDIQRAVERSLAYWTGSDGAIGSQGVNALVEVLGRSWRIDISLLQEIRSEGEKFRQLTEEQFSLLDHLAAHRRALVSGCAGAGKTFLAAEKARRLANEGFRTLLTCYNKNLAEWLNASMHPLPDNLIVQHFHALAHDLVVEAGLHYDAPESGDMSTYFTEVLPDRLLDATEHVTTRFDAIVVDEGQDFQEEWWVPLQALLADPAAGIWYVFYDAEQCLYTDHPAPPFEAAPILLTTNLRSTRQIHKHVAEFYDAPITCRGPEGRPPTIITTTDPKAELQRCLHALVNEEKIPPTDIMILTPANRNRSRWREGLRLGNLTLTWSPPTERLQVPVSTIHGFKGLESPIVIVTEMDSLGEHHRDKVNQLRLVAYSRAKSELYVIEPAG